MVNEVHCRRDISMNMCGHNAKAKGDVIDLYRVHSALCDLLTTLKDKPMKDLVSTDAHEHTRLSPTEFDSLYSSDQ